MAGRKEEEEAAAALEVVEEEEETNDGCTSMLVQALGMQRPRSPSTGVWMDVSNVCASTLIISFLMDTVQSSLPFSAITNPWAFCKRRRVQAGAVAWLSDSSQISFDKWWTINGSLSRDGVFISNLCCIG